MRALVVVLCMLVASSASAQRSESAEARDLFDRGYALLVEGRFPEARDLLRESFDRLARQATAYNLVLALVGTEAPLAATALCDRLLAAEFGPLRGAHADQVAVECNRARASIAEITLTLTDAPVGAIVRVDGVDRETVEDPSAPITLRVDPGAHVVSVVADPHPVVEQRVVFAHGEHLALALRVPGAPNDDPLVIGGIIGGATGVLAIVAIIIGVVIASSSSSAGSAISDPVFGVVMALD